MSVLLRILGAGWAIIGAANIFYMPDWKNPSGSGFVTFGLIFNFVLFIIPGLILYGVGAAIARRRRVASPAPPPAPVEERLVHLTKLRDTGTISDSEYQQRRQEILRQV